MNRYILYCTPEQTKKALELGAPIRNFLTEKSSRKLIATAKSENRVKEYEEELLKYHQTIIGDIIYCIPTAEQLLGWLEETYDLHIKIDYRRDYADDADGNIVDEWYYYCFFLSIADKCFYGEDTLDEYPTRKEATLAAIDAALEYLLTSKK